MKKCNTEEDCSNIIIIGNMNGNSSNDSDRQKKRKINIFYHECKEWKKKFINNFSIKTEDKGGEMSKI